MMVVNKRLSRSPSRSQASCVMGLLRPASIGLKLPDAMNPADKDVTQEF